MARPAPAAHPTRDDTDLLNGLSGRLSLSEIVRRSTPAIVSIMTELPGEGRARGTGFFANAEGLVVTSNHLVKNATSIQLKTHDGTRFNNVKVVLARNDADLAVLQIPDLHVSEPYLRLGNSDHVTVGEKIMAIGHPMGLEYTASDGIVSALRDTEVDDMTLIQFSAPASPGSSGGPLLDEFGQVIGIISMSHPEGQILNFAVPSNLARTALVALGRPLPAARNADGGPDAVAPEAAAVPVALHPAAVPEGVDLVPSTPVVAVVAPLPRHTFTQAGRGFSMACPQNWPMHATNEPNSIVVHLESPDGQVRFHLLSTAVDNGMTLDAFSDEVMRTARSLMAARPSEELAPLRAPAPPHMVRAQRTSVAGLDWKLFVYSHSDRDSGDVYSVIMVTVQNGRGYVVRYSVPVNEWMRAREAVREVVDSIQIL
jgi:S1-C subfamily serine protease